jgi:hypothetical protein
MSGLYDTSTAESIEAAVADFFRRSGYIVYRQFYVGGSEGGTPRKADLVAINPIAHAPSTVGVEIKSNAKDLVADMRDPEKFRWMLRAFREGYYAVPSTCTWLSVSAIRRHMEGVEPYLAITGPTQLGVLYIDTDSRRVVNVVRASPRAANAQDECISTLARIERETRRLPTWVKNMEKFESRFGGPWDRRVVDRPGSPL